MIRPVHFRLFITTALLLVLAERVPADAPQDSSQTNFSVRASDKDPAVMLLGEDYWKNPSIPDPHTGAPSHVPPENVIDILILGDGYQASQKERFDRDVASWYRSFLALHPFSEMRHIFRVRSYWTPSAYHAGQTRTSVYHVGVDANNGVTDSVNAAMSQAIMANVDRVGLNKRTLPDGRYSHAYIAMLVKTDDGGGTPGGRPIIIVSPDKKRSISASFGEDALHEFGHAFAGLSDEYIETANQNAKPVFTATPSLLNKNFFPESHNLTTASRPDQLPWRHIKPGSNLNPDPASLVGSLWIGGEGGEFGVWHSEPMCLMNGGHDNWNREKTERKGWLRTSHFCFICEESIAAYTYYLAGFLGTSSDGALLWQEWEKLRPAYTATFRVQERIGPRNRLYAQAGFDKSPLRQKPTALIAQDGSLRRGVRLLSVASGCALFDHGKVACSQSPSAGSIWTFEGDVNGFVRIKNKDTGRYLLSEDDRSEIRTGSVHEGAWSSHWVLNQLETNTFSIVSRWTNALVAVDRSGNVVKLSGDTLERGNAWVVEKE